MERVSNVRRITRKRYNLFFFCKFVMLVILRVPSGKHLDDPDEPVRFPVGQAHVAPPVGGPHLVVVRRPGVPQHKGLEGPLRPRVAELEEALRVVGAEVQEAQLLLPGEEGGLSIPDQTYNQQLGCNCKALPRASCT